MCRWGWGCGAKSCIFPSLPSILPLQTDILLGQTAFDTRSSARLNTRPLIAQLPPSLTVEARSLEVAARSRGAGG